MYIRTTPRVKLKPHHATQDRYAWYGRMGSTCEVLYKADVGNAPRVKPKPRPAQPMTILPARNEPLISAILHSGRHAGCELQHKHAACLHQTVLVHRFSRTLVYSGCQSIAQSFLAAAAAHVSDGQNGALHAAQLWPCMLPVSRCAGASWAMHWVHLSFGLCMPQLKELE